MAEYTSLFRNRQQRINQFSVVPQGLHRDDLSRFRANPVGPYRTRKPFLYPNAVVEDDSAGVSAAPPPDRPPEEYLKVIPPPKKQQAKNFGHVHVGTKPFRILISGKTGSGKGVLLYHLMNYYYSKEFPRIYWFSPTFETDETFEERKWEPSAIFNQWDPGMIEKLAAEQRSVIMEKKTESTISADEQRIRQQRKRVEGMMQMPKSLAGAAEITAKKKRGRPSTRASGRAYTASGKRRKAYSRFMSENGQPNPTFEDMTDEQKPNGDHMLFVIDDFASDLDAMADPTLAQVAFSGRHYKISLILLTQKYNRVNLNIRTNLSVGFFFRATNKKEAELIADEQACPLINRKEFLQMYGDATTNEQYDFLTVNHEVSDMCTMYRHNLTEIINLPFDFDEKGNYRTTPLYQDKGVPPLHTSNVSVNETDTVASRSSSSSSSSSSSNNGNRYEPKTDHQVPSRLNV